jgi:hypothetical protein
MPHLLPLPIRFTRDADGRTGGSTALNTAIVVPCINAEGALTRPGPDLFLLPLFTGVRGKEI